MKNTCNALKYTCSLLLMLLVFNACDKDYSSIESDVLGGNNFNFSAVDSIFPILVYNKNLKAQQINGNGANLLGFHDDPDFGKTTASIVTQVIPSSFANVDFGEEVEIDSVTLTIPYYSTQTGLEDGKPIYKLDSLFVEQNDPAKASPIKLTVYENKYFLSDLEPYSPDALNYFSKAVDNSNTTDNFAITGGNTTINFDEHKDYKLCDTIGFKPSSEPISIKTITETDTTITYFKPAIKLELAASELDKAFWKTLIIDEQGNPTLSNANNFKNHFRGLYIKAEAIDSKGSMVLLNLLDSEANIVVHYSKKGATDTERVNETYKLNFIGNRLNTFINDYKPEVLVTNPDETNGDEKLYLKGTEGSMAVIELFPGDNMIDCKCGVNQNGQPIIITTTPFDCFKKTFRKTDENGQELDPINGQYQLKRLINEAMLVVYEDESLYNEEDPNKDVYHAYDRLLIYDLENNTPIIDYSTDPSADPTDPLTSRAFSLGRRITDDEEGVSKYKLRLTDHLNNILIRNGDNPKLGLVLSNNVNLFINTAILNGGDAITGIPSTTLIAPRGTILHGNNVAPENDNKRMKLELFFTEPKGNE
ncbi:DUF4270 domain-containing protein [Algibacter sp. 2305UL17-15]|uniref:DUF4270 domain-containing protein n=1 Tax=Algibacter sp. 2305UL17-15 TaxID=3231268 RepID=UPI0034588F1E